MAKMPQYVINRRNDSPKRAVYSDMRHADEASITAVNAYMPTAAARTTRAPPERRTASPASSRFSAQITTSSKNPFLAYCA